MFFIFYFLHGVFIKRYTNVFYFVQVCISRHTLTTEVSVYQYPFATSDSTDFLHLPFVFLYTYIFFYHGEEFLFAIELGLGCI